MITLTRLGRVKFAIEFASRGEDCDLSDGKLVLH